MPDMNSCLAADLIDEKIRSLNDWRGETLRDIRSLILKAGPAVIEEIKWQKPTNPAGVPVWSHAGILCTGETYKNKVKRTSANGAKLADPSGLFKARLEGSMRCATDLAPGAWIDK